MPRFFTENGKHKPITSKKIRDISDNDVNVDIDVNAEDNADELEEFAKEKFAEMDEKEVKEELKDCEDIKEKVDELESEILDWTFYLF